MDASIFSVVGKEANFLFHAVDNETDGVDEGCDDGCVEGSGDGFCVGRKVRLTSRGSGEEVVGS